MAFKSIIGAALTYLAVVSFAEAETPVQDTMESTEPGVASIQTSLGRAYEKGKGIKQDYHQAASWYRKAAEQGYAPAQSGLGFLYAIGKGVKQDYRQAASWYRKAAEQGYDEEQDGLGILYADVKDVNQNKQITKEWFKKACDAGDQDGCNSYRTLNEKGI